VAAAQRLLECGGRGDLRRRRLDDLRLVSIGPQTSARCRQLLERVDAEADPHDLRGLVDACARVFRAGP
jgi:uroporphyrinogen-III synthase